MAVTVGFSLFMDSLGYFTEAKLEAKRPNTAFVYAPDAFSFIVAVLAGIAGTLSLTSAKSGALVGVAADSQEDAHRASGKPVTTGPHDHTGPRNTKNAPAAINAKPTR